MPREVQKAGLNDFGAIADVYDELVDWAPYEKWVGDLQARLTRWGLRPGHLILDAACGTGLSMLPWLKRGYRVIGADVEPRMLERARRRLWAAGYEVPLLEQDLLNLRVPEPCDAAVCMHSGLDYILDMEDLERALVALRGCLRTGGLLAFDKCLDEPAFYRPEATETRRLSCGRAEFRYRWDRRRRLMEQRLVVVRERGAGPRRTEVVFHLKAVPLDELLAMALRAGFSVLEPPRQFRVSDPGMGIFRAV